MIADNMTKPLEGTVFERFRDLIMGVNRVSPTTNMAPMRLGPQKCVGENTNMTGTNIKAGTTIIFSNPLTVGNSTDVTRSNIGNQVAI
jgi:hypothetical protein